MNYETDTVLCTRKTEERDRLMKTHDKRTIQHGRSTIDLLGGGGGGVEAAFCIQNMRDFLVLEPKYIN